MKVPQYDELTVAPRALPGSRQESIASTATLGGNSAENLEALGKGMQNAGSAGVQIAAAMQERTNADRVFATETALKEELISFDTAQRAKKGAAVLAEGGITTQTEKWFGETVQRHMGNLDNPRQRQVFNEIAGKLRVQTLDTMSKHQAAEARVSMNDSTNASIVASINRAAANANDWTIVESERGEIRRRVQVLGTLNGYTPEIAEAITSEKLTALHKQVIQQLVVSNPAAAKTYFDKYKDEIAGSERAEVGQFAEKAAATRLGDTAADEVWKELGPKTRTDAVALADMEEKVRGKLRGNDDAVTKAIAGLRERATAYKDQRKEEGNALEASVNGLILKGASAGQIRSSPEFLKLSVQAPDDARKILTFLENQAYTREARAAVAEQRQDAAKHRATFGKLLELSDPNKLMSMTRDEVTNLLPTLGTQSTMALVSKWEAYTKNGAALSEAKLDDQQFKVFAQRAGLDITPKDDGGKERMVILRDKVERILGTEQMARKRALTRDEKDVILNREIDNEVMQNRWYWFDKKVPAIVLPDEKSVMKNAYVEVGPKNTKVLLSDIPATFRRNAIAERQKQGLATPERTLAELWLRSKGAPKAEYLK